MIDTHCHLLPGIDDGPRTTAESLQLARALVDAGVRIAICTPHLSRRYPTDHTNADRRVRELAGTLRAQEIPLRVALAAELSPAAAVDATVDELMRWRLGHAHVLVELEPDTPSAMVEVVLERLAGHGLRPVFAHPERCRAVRTQPRVIESAKAHGALIQIVARSLAGDPQGGTQQAAWRLLDGGRVDILASDCHHVRHASGPLVRALEAVSARFGARALRALIETNPLSLFERRSARQ